MWLGSTRGGLFRGRRHRFHSFPNVDAMAIAIDVDSRCLGRSMVAGVWTVDYVRPVADRI